jgi:hypothetical protein
MGQRVESRISHAGFPTSANTIGVIILLWFAVAAGSRSLLICENLMEHAPPASIDPCGKLLQPGSKQIGGLLFLQMIGFVFLFSGASVGFMPSDDATRRRSQKAMMRGIMSCDATDKSALQAALCFGR